MLPESAQVPGALFSGYLVNHAAFVSEKSILLTLRQRNDIVSV